MKLTDASGSLAKHVGSALDEMRPRAVAVAGYDRPEMRKAIRWANRNRVPAILMSETKWDDRPRPWWRLAAARHWVRRCDSALVSGAAAGEFLVALGMPRERIFRQYGVVDNQFFADRAEEARRKDARPHPDLPEKYFIASCRMIEKRKNLRRLLLAYEEYRGCGGDLAWGLVLCGDGEDRAMLEEVATSRSIGGVHFAGFQQVEQLALYYAHASCFVHPAINEAWGLVVNEAMAAGLPIIVSRRCGCAYDLVNEGVNGFTFDPFDTEQLSRRMLCITKMQAHQVQSFGVASRVLVDSYGPAQFANGLSEALDAASTCLRRLSPLQQPSDPE
jgi:glycosyltransferase involved in cell wall biosynthesis